MQSKVEICGVNTSHLEVLTPEETDSLLRRSAKGDPAAREKLISCNLRLVLSVIQRFSNRGESMDDLFQVGCIGLIKSIDHFNVDLNVRFSTYAVPMIIGEVRRYLRDNSSIRVSRSMRDTAYKPKKLLSMLISGNLPSKNWQRRWMSPGRISFLPWMPSPIRYPCMNRYLKAMEMRSVSWIRWAIPKIPMNTGWNRLSLKRPFPGYLPGNSIS